MYLRKHFLNVQLGYFIATTSKNKFSKKSQLTLKIVPQFFSPLPLQLDLRLYFGKMLTIQLSPIMKYI